MSRRKKATRPSTGERAQDRRGFGRAESRAAWRSGVLATVAACILGSLVWVGFFPALPLSSRVIQVVTPLPVLVWSAEAFVVGTVIGVTLLRQPAALRPIQISAAVGVSGVVAWSLAPEMLSAYGIVSLVASAVVAFATTRWGSDRLTWALGIVSLLVVLTIYGMYTGVLPGPMRSVFQQRLQPNWAPAVHQPYDAYDFIEAARLMRGGLSYYPAYTQAIKADTRNLPLASPFNFRPPLVISLWSALPMSSMGDLAGYSVAVGALCAIVGFLIASEFVAPGVAVVAAVLICRLYGQEFLAPFPLLGLTEYWVAPIGLLGLWLTLRGQWIAAALALCFGMLGREMTVLLLPAWYIALYQRAEMPLTRKHVYAGGAALSGALCLGVPYFMARGFTQGPSTGVSPWTNGGFDRLIQDVTLSHNGIGIVAMAPQVSLFVFAAALLAVATIPSRQKLAIVAGAVGVYTVFLVCISGGDWSSYWGVPYLVMLMSFAPVLASRFAPCELRLGGPTPPGRS